MFRRSVVGLSLFGVFVCCIGLQLPTEMGTKSVFGVFGAEMVAIGEPKCNAIAPKMRNCREINSSCKDLPYILGPQSADPGGVNTERYDKIGTVLEWRGPGIPKNTCPDQDPYKLNPDKCEKVYVSSSD